MSAANNTIEPDINGQGCLQPVLVIFGIVLLVGLLTLCVPYMMLTGDRDPQHSTTVHDDEPGR